MDIKIRDNREEGKEYRCMVGISEHKNQVPSTYFTEDSVLGIIRKELETGSKYVTISYVPKEDLVINDVPITLEEGVDLQSNDPLCFQVHYQLGGMPEYVRLGRVDNEALLNVLAGGEDVTSITVYC